MNLANMLNEPVERTIGNKTYKIKRLSLRDLFVTLAKIQQDKFEASIYRLAEKMPEKERNKFIIKALKETEDNDMVSVVQSGIKSIEGIYEVMKLALNKLQKVTDEELDEVLSAQNMEQISAVIGYVIGTEAVNKENETEIPDELKKK